jgi:hypothetical protein
MTPSPPRASGGSPGAGGDEAARGAVGARRDDRHPAARPDDRPVGARRDRDAAGRPRNARPRDELGRPLSRDAAGQPPADDEAVLSPGGSLALAQQLIDDGRPFRAHEVLEASWKAAPAAERELWQGLAQVAVGLTHVQRGNPRGAVALLRRGAGRVGEYSAVCPHGIDAGGVVRSASGLADLIERDGLSAVPPDRMLIRLRAAGYPGSVGG